MANYGPYYGSFGGSFSNVYSQLKIDSWTVGSTQVTFHAYGGFYADYNWSINSISSELFWWENGTWYSLDYGDGFSISTGSGGGSAWWIDETGYFTRTSYDRTVKFANDLKFSGNSASAVSATLTVPHLAAAPTNVTATRNSDTSITIKWTNPSTSYTTLYIEASRNGGSYTQIASVGTSSSYTWASAQADSVYSFRVRTYYESSYSNYTATVNAYTTPTAPSSLSYTRSSDTKVNLSWTNNSSSYTQVRVERQTDGGSWSQIASLGKGSTSYSDTTTSADHAYKYRVRAYNGGMYSSYATSATTITMTPAAPTKITLARSGATDVAVTLTNNSNTATSLEWQASQDKSTWSASTTVNGKVTSFTATGLSGTYYIRVRNKNSTGTSAWLVSEAITTLQPPAAPTLVSPSGVYSMSEGNITFAWLHNSRDGSAQSAYTLSYSTNGGSTWTDVTGTTSQSYTMAIPWSAGTTVTWKVKTKGADASYGDYSSINTVYIYQEPSLSFVASNPPSTVTSVPIPIEVSYSDPQGMACAEATVALYDGDNLLYTEPLTINGGTLEGEITAQEYLLEDGGTYTVVVTARSGSTLQSTANATFGVSYTPPNTATLTIDDDPETGYANLIVQYVAGSDLAIDHVDVFRVTDGRMAIAVEQSDGASIVDKYAPLNTPYQYAVVSYASSGAYAVTMVDNIIETDRWFAYWDDGLAWAKWNPEGSYSLSRPEKVRVRYAGRKWPVSYDSKAIEQTHTMSWTVVDMDDWENGFVQLMEDGGRGVYKSCDGLVFHADFEYSANQEYKSINRIWQVRLAITRIDGDQL